MKSRLITYFLSIFLLLAGTLAAQVPQTMSYQAVARDADGNCLNDQLISLQISVLGDTLDGPVVYVERFECSTTTNGFGHFQIDIGAGTPQIGGEVQAFSDIAWNNRKHFLKVEYAPECTTAFVTVGTTELLAVPYALVADNGKTFSNNNRDEFMRWYGQNGNINGTIGGAADSEGNYNLGGMNVSDKNGDARALVRLENTSDGDASGRMDVRGANGSANVIISRRTSDDANFGAIRVYDDGANNDIYLGMGSTGEGVIDLNGGNGNNNVFIGKSNTDHPSHGRVTVHDINGTEQAGMRVQNDGTGYIYADGANGGVKSFVMPHPNRPGKDIVYACIEGPEVAAYERGTAELANGEAEIVFSETFAIVGNHETMTVTITPRSPESEGLAAFEYTATGFKVKELHRGRGNYKFDWKVEAVRKGWEDWEVIRDDETEEMDETDKPVNTLNDEK